MKYGRRVTNLKEDTFKSIVRIFTSIANVDTKVVLIPLIARTFLKNTQGDESYFRTKYECMCCMQYTTIFSQGFRTCASMAVPNIFIFSLSDTLCIHTLSFYSCWNRTRYNFARRKWGPVRHQVSVYKDDFRRPTQRVMVVKVQRVFLPRGTL